MPRPPIYTPQHLPQLGELSHLVHLHLGRVYALTGPAHIDRLWTGFSHEKEKGFGMSRMLPLGSLYFYRTHILGRRLEPEYSRTWIVDSPSRSIPGESTESRIINRDVWNPRAIIELQAYSVLPLGCD